MSERTIVATPSAYSYPLLIKQLLHTPLMQSPQQEIVYRDLQRFTYADLRDRIGRLGSALAKIGVRPGDTVGVLDWDSNRFLEAFFAIPMMGAILQTVNVRLSPEQVAYTIDHAGSSTLLVNDEFVDLVHSILPKLPKVRQLVVISDRKAPATGELQFIGEYEELLAAASPDFRFPDFDENVQATTFYTTGTTGLPKGRVLQPSASRVARDGGARAVWPGGETGPFPSRRRLYADHADVPRSRMGVPMGGDACRGQAGLPRPLRSGPAHQAHQDGRRDLHTLRANHPGDAARRGGECQR